MMGSIVCKNNTIECVVLISVNVYIPLHMIAELLCRLGKDQKLVSHGTSMLQVAKETGQQLAVSGERVMTPQLPSANVAI